MRVFGIDPGLNATGFGVLDADGLTFTAIAAGDIRPPKKVPLPQRLGFLHEELNKLFLQYRPDIAVLEMVFTHHRYVSTAALMAHARGVACLVTQERNVPLAQYPPARIKRSVTGYGNASKDQVARMVAQRLGLREMSWSSDAADALALAIGHVHMESSIGLMRS